MGKTVEDATMIADRANTASVLQELGGRKKNCVTVSPSSLSYPGIDSERIPNSKIFVTATSPSTAYNGRLTGRKNFAMHFSMPRTRAIYNFGDSSSKLSLINETIRFGIHGETSSNVSRF